MLIAVDLNCKHGSWNSLRVNANDSVLFDLGQHLNFNKIGPDTPTRYPYQTSLTHFSPEVLDIALLKEVSLVLPSIGT